MEHLQDSNMSGGGSFYLKKSTSRNNSCSVIGNNNNGQGGGGGTKCGRWNPTTEQVKVLTELFRAGLRTPSTDQIQKISSQLSFYGKIESKNVFYWFQNHKARERQKRRRGSDDDFDVDDQLHVMVRKDDKISSARLLQERNQGGLEMEKTIETLQLFPVNSFVDKSQPNYKPIMEFSVIGCQDDYENISKCAYKIGSYELNNEHPPLDLRLSFV